MGSETLVLAIDQGTTSTRAILFDATGRARSSARIALTQLHPRPGWVEHDPEEIGRSVVSTCREAIATADGPIAAVGITNQRETSVLWERATGRPVHNAVVWQDRRSAGLCENWRAAGLAEIVARRTGLVVDPYFSASKIRWLLDSVPGLRQRAEAGEIAFGTIDSFLLWRLSGGRRHATDITNAARTMLFDIRRFAWDAELLDAFGIPRALLPEVLDTDGNYGATTPDLFGAAIPITGIAGDQQAAAIGQACFRPGMIKTTYGTGAFALLNIGHAPVASRHNLLTTIAYRLGGETAYALEGSIFAAGATVEWLRDRVGAIADAAQVANLAARADPRQRLYLVPGFAGLGAPYWAPQARGGLLGLTAECGLSEIARTALEAVGYQTRDLIEGWRPMRKSRPMPCASMAGWRPAIGRCSSSPISCRRASNGRPRSKPPHGVPPMSRAWGGGSTPTPRRWLRNGNRSAVLPLRCPQPIAKSATPGGGAPSRECWQPPSRLRRGQVGKPPLATSRRRGRRTRRYADDQARPSHRADRLARPGKPAGVLVRPGGSRMGAGSCRQGAIALRR